jgi:hypothetical protein
MRCTPSVRLAAACLLSVAVYFLAFAFVLDRPLALGLPRLQIDAKLARGAAIPGRKLVILAGSNGPYSHRCETIEPLLAIPCVNAGVAVGIGLDYLFARWKPLLKPGDIVYLPLEEAQYVRGRAETAVGPDAAIMLRHDWATLGTLRAERWEAALFPYDLRGAVMSLIESALVAARFHDPRAEAIGGMNAWGDHVGHTAVLGAANRAMLARLTPHHVTAAAIEAGYGTRIVAGFLDWAPGHGIVTVGGLPTAFADAPMPPATEAAIRAVFQRHGARFLTLTNRAAYPRADFFDTAEHLNEAAQIAHSKLVAAALSADLGRSATVRNDPVAVPGQPPSALHVTQRLTAP